MRYETVTVVKPSEVYSFLGKEKVMAALANFRVAGFRPPEVGETFLALNGNGAVVRGSLHERNLGGFSGGPRFIIEPRSVWE